MKGDPRTAELMAKPGVRSVGYGYRYKDGKRTGEKAIIVMVGKKLPAAQLTSQALIPRRFGKDLVDVQEVGEIEILALKHKVTPRIQEFSARLRPCPGGFSVGHKDITAGTLGCRIVQEDLHYILSNNHVLANSNAAVVGDPILQPGPYDGGVLPDDRIAVLDRFVAVNLGGGTPVPDPTGCLGQFFPKFLRKRAQAIQQPDPNLVDCALARVLEKTFVDEAIYKIGPPLGFLDSQPLGLKVRKSGRTTEYTEGIVDQVNVTTQVSYGDAGVATYEDQIVVRQGDGSDFSAGGDSGSAIVGPSGEVIGLLFAGGNGATIANRIGHVIRLLGLQV